MKKRKLLIIGATGFNRIDENNILESYSWNETNKIKNVRDYDTVIINLLTIENDLLELDKDEAKRLFNFRASYDITKANGGIIFVGDPRKIIPYELENDLFEDDQNSIPITYFTGINFFWDDNPGNTIVPSYGRQEGFIERYVNRFQKWDYSLSTIQPNKKAISEVFNIQKLERELGYEIITEQNVYCHNRYQNPLIFSANIKLVKRGRHGIEEDSTELGDVLVLPEISLSTEDTINLILEDICGLEAPLEKPDWLSEYKAPKQREIDKKIEKVEEEIELKHQELEKLQEELKTRRRSLKLFYESGKELEKIVLDTLSELGADIEKPTEKGKEDGWIYVEIDSESYSGVLEIKGTKNTHFNDKGRKQLLDWVDRGITLRQTKYKGIFIGNHSKNKDPRERENPYADNWVKSAELSEVSAITTTELYIIYSKYKIDDIDIEEFWEKLFETNGPIDIDEFIEEED